MSHVAHDGGMLDVTAPEYVEIEIRDDGSVLWIHIDGIAMFRACRIANLEITDRRE